MWLLYILFISYILYIPGKCNNVGLLLGSKDMRVSAVASKSMKACKYANCAEAIST